MCRIVGGLFWHPSGCGPRNGRPPRSGRQPHHHPTTDEADDADDAAHRPRRPRRPRRPPDQRWWTAGTGYFVLAFFVSIPVQRHM